MHRSFFAIAVGLAVGGSPASAARVLLHCGRLIDGATDTPRESVTLIVNSNRIAAIEAGYLGAATGDKVIDLKDRTVLPGLIDLHVHLQSEPGSPQTYAERGALNPEDYAYRATKNARITLRAGFTTVRDLGGEQVPALKRYIADGSLEGPRIIAAGKSIATTGGHADPSNGFNRELAGDPGPERGVINSPDDARKAVRQRVKEGADVIKITATGGVMSLARDGFRPQFTQEEANAIVQVASDAGLAVAAHAHGAEGMKRAVLAGVTSIEHGTMMTEEVMALMKERGTWYIPTLSAGRHTAEKAEIPGYYPAVVAMKAKAISPLMMNTFSNAWRSGVKIAFGTDSGVYPHGDNAKEFQYMLEVGMPAMKAIQAATSQAAQVLKLDRDLGTLTAGKFADVIAVAGNPLDDIKALQDVRFVMKDGVVYKDVR